MGKNKKSPITEQQIILPAHPASLTAPIADTHCHLLSTYASYAQSFPPPNNSAPTLPSFVQKVLQPANVSAVVDVWCDAPVVSSMLEIVDALAEVEGLDYRFVVGVHPHESKHYNDKVEEDIKTAYASKWCAGWGEIGLDYHYDNSPKDVQQSILRRQIRTALASGLGKAFTIHTREADDDIWTILTEELPKDAKVHVHCYTDTLELAVKLLNHFPNLMIGITGVATYSSNHNTTSVLRHFAQSFSSAPTPSTSTSTSPPSPLRILLETDSPFMTPAALQKGGKKMPFSHSGMIPYIADYIAKVLNEELEKKSAVVAPASTSTEGAEEVKTGGEGETGNGVESVRKWETEDVLRIARDNARIVYGF